MIRYRKIASFKCSKHPFWSFYIFPAYKRCNGHWTATVVESRKAATELRLAYKAEFDISQTEIPRQNGLSLIIDWNYYRKLWLGLWNLSLLSENPFRIPYKRIIFVLFQIENDWDRLKPSLISENPLYSHPLYPKLTVCTFITITNFSVPWGQKHNV